MDELLFDAEKYRFVRETHQDPGRSRDYSLLADGVLPNYPRAAGSTLISS